MAADQTTGKGGLRRRLTLAFLLVGLIPAIVVGFIGVRQSLHAAQAARLESEERLIAMSAEAVAATLRTGLRILGAAAEEDSLRRVTTARDRKRLRAEVRSVHRQFPEFASVLILTPTGSTWPGAPLKSGRSGLPSPGLLPGVLRSRAPTCPRSRTSERPPGS
jgi:hypothetical protein